MSLADKVTKPPVREKVVADCMTLIDAEVKAKGGLSGIMIKTGYSMVKTFKPGFVRDVVDGLLDQWVEKLEPFFATWKTEAGGKGFGVYLDARKDAVAEALLSVTDAKSKTSKNGSVKKMYEKMRPSAKRNVEDAIPKLGALLEKHEAAPAAKA